MAAGVDTDKISTDFLAQLKAMRIDFVGRYYANKGKKVLTQSEAAAISSAGLKIVALWEDGFPTTSKYFSYTKGVDDGGSAYHDAMVIGQPIGAPIYFTVDYDAEPAAIAGCINDYFRGIQAGFAAASAGQAAYLVGVYGSGATCSSLLGQQLVRYTWLSQSTSFRGYNQFASWNIRQGKTEKRFGVFLDSDVSTAEYGGFSVLR